VNTLRTAICCFYIASRRAFQDPEVRGGRSDVRAKRRSAQRLAVGTMADSNVVDLDFRFESDFPAVTPPIHFHDLNPP
jgi:hypothetical protein